MSSMAGQRAPSNAAASLLLAAGLAGLLAAAAYLAAGWYRDMQTQLDEVRSLNARTAETIRRGRSLLAESTAGGVGAFDLDYLASRQETMAAADLQSRVRDHALDRQLDLISLVTLAPRDISDATFVGVRLSARAPLPQLQALLHAVETDRPILFIERAIIRAEPAAIRNDPSAAASGPPLLVDVDVYTPIRPAAVRGPADVRVVPRPDVRQP
jgi:hypothetical protein